MFRSNIPTTKSESIPYNLYHLSLNPNLSGIWYPKQPDGHYTNDSNLFYETPIAKISLSPSISQCYQAIYANIKLLYNEKNDVITFNVYKPVFKGNELVILPKTFTEQEMIHDAHITEEHGVITPLNMVLLGKAAIKCPSSCDKMYYNAFNKDSKYKYGWLPSPVNIIDYHIK